MLKDFLVETICSLYSEGFLKASVMTEGFASSFPGPTPVL